MAFPVPTVQGKAHLEWIFGGNGTVWKEQTGKQNQDRNGRDEASITARQINGVVLGEVD